jgi:type I restriction enzyme S subunit
MKINSVNTVSLGEVLEYEQPTKYIVDNTNYDDEFEIPVLTAGKSFLLGYTNETHNVFSNVPVIIFDDFTTAFKYVDFPFKVKSSAMKILKANKEIADIRFLYYRMMKTGIDTELHKRYWISKYSKVKIPLPPLDQQKKIAAILDSADAYRQKTKGLIEKYDELTQSLFLDMFGDPVSNPKGWDVKTIGDCFNVKGGKRLPKGSEYETIVTKHAYIRVKDFMANGLDTSNIKYISEEIHDKISRYTISSNDVYISIAGTIGLSGYVPESLSGANLTENAAKLIPKKGIEFRKEYLSFYLNSNYAQQNIKSKTMAVGVPKLALFRIQELPYIDAPINAQDIFVRRAQAIEAQKAQTQDSLAQADHLFNSLLQKAFKKRGELLIINDEW